MGTILTASNLAYFINQLDKQQTFNYINPRNKGLIKLVNVTLPEGPISIKRWILGKRTEKEAKVESISTEMLWRVANSFIENTPVNFDRVLGGSYNTRSVLEALLAHTPQFYFCNPGRFETKASVTVTKKGHKHLLWRPNEPHKRGIVQKAEVAGVVLEVAVHDAYLPRTDLINLPSQNEIPISNTDRRHCFMQVALYHIGKQLGYKTWIAQNDKGIIHDGKRIAEHAGVIEKLDSEKVLMAYSEAQKRAKFIDCIWFQNGKLMPAVIEVEHSTGVTSGLDRMRHLQSEIPAINTRYVIVASDENRQKVVNEANKQHYKPLDTRFFSYSSVEELLALCTRRKIQGVTEHFLDCYMEKVVH